jgi:hypothetical protein
MVPYQARHPGLAIDRSPNTCTPKEMQKQGEWQTHKSLSVRASHGGDHAGVAPSRNRLPNRGQLKGRYFADIFSEHGGVSCAVRAMHIPAKEYEIQHDDHGDLTSARARRALKNDARTWRLLAAMLAPPCSSFSIARDGTCPIRSREHPWGLPKLSLKDRDKVKLGNLCLMAVLDLFHVVQKFKIPRVLEQHATSKMPSANQCLVKLVDFCQYGKQWHKRTQLVCGNVDVQEAERLSRRCTGKPGICSRTNRAHFQLSGSSTQGVPWTAIAMPYPGKLCHDLAHALGGHLIA